MLCGRKKYSIRGAVNLHKLTHVRPEAGSNQCLQRPKFDAFGLQALLPMPAVLSDNISDGVNIDRIQVL